MLALTIPDQDLWDEKNDKFIIIPGELILLEHSLVSLSKWESIAEKPFLGPETVKKTPEETLLYIKCMTISPVSSDAVYDRLTADNFKEIADYIDQKMTATTFSQIPGAKGSGEYVSAEIMYHWIVALTLPTETQYWHLNRFLALVRVINIKNTPPEKMSRQNKQDLIARRKALNAQRQAEHNTTG